MKLKMRKLIENAYNKLQAQEYTATGFSLEDQNILGGLGREILEKTMSEGLVCAYLSAMWVRKAREKFSQPIHVIAGSLNGPNFPIFDTKNNDKPISEIFKPGLNSWEGHVWCNFNGLIGEASIFRTARERPQNSRLRQLVENEFSPNAGLAIMPSDDSYPFEYIPEYVLNDNQIDQLIDSYKKMTQK